VLDRTPYFEVSITQGSSPERWVRLQFEPAAPVGICLDADPGPGVALFAGHAVEIEAAPCPATEAAPLRGARDGVFGAGALRELVVSVDYDDGRIGFRPRD
jgi:hypothetical protein